MGSTDSHHTSVPEISENLRQAIVRLGNIRCQLKDLETEEALIRDQILNHIQEWPQSWFPLRVTPFELNRQRRPGRVESEQARNILRNEGVLDRVPMERVIRDQAALADFDRKLSCLKMPSATRAQLAAQLSLSIGEVPQITPKILGELYDVKLLDGEAYFGCFRDGKPFTTVLVVR